MHKHVFLPVGVFVIQGVSSCINGTGYCLLGEKCQIDIDFLPDDAGGHCDGLENAFTPKTKFVCCRYVYEVLITIFNISCMLFFL